MAHRVTAAEVKEIISTVLTEGQCNPFITAANLTVTNRLSNEGLSSDTLKEIERWLAAHFIYIRNPKTKRKRIGDATDEYNLPMNNDGLQGTPYGQQVLLLDTSGVMATAGKRAAKIVAIWDSSSA